MLSTSIPYQAGYGPLSSLQGLNYGDADGSNGTFGGPFLQGGGGLSDEPNSGETLKQNMQLAHHHVLRVQSLARSALAGIENAYHPGTNPLQTAADMGALKEALEALEDVVRQTGVGALPIEVRDVREEQMVAETAHAVQMLYERHKRIQESAGVVVGLLGAGEQAGRHVSHA
ncbi:hypothetical protein B0H21DRAFT_892514 [Amylocystis lapponica]|nr:hypothetical protein B0H21DRAFT_892514 [Amylocystis lapponica]